MTTGLGHHYKKSIVNVTNQDKSKNLVEVNIKGGSDSNIHHVSLTSIAGIAILLVPVGDLTIQMYLQKHYIMTCCIYIILSGMFNLAVTTKTRV